MSANNEQFFRTSRVMSGLVAIALSACVPEPAEQEQATTSPTSRFAQAQGAALITPRSAGGHVLVAERAAGDAVISTQRTAAGFEVYVNGIKRGLIVNREPSNTVVTTVSSDGRYAVAIADHDGTQGSALLIMEAGQAAKTLVRNKVTSAAFSTDGSQLAYVVSGSEGATVYQGTAHTPGRAVATLHGTAVTILGWRSDGKALFVVAYPSVESDAAIAPNLLSVNLKSGASTKVLTSDPAHGLVYRDLRLLRMDGTQFVSAIRAPSVYPCGDSVTDIVLARTDGTITRSVARTMDSYREAVWSADGKYVAFTAQACVSAQEKADLSAAARAEAVAGTYVAETSTGQVTQLMADISSFQLSDLDAGVLRLASTRLGTRSVEMSAMRNGTRPAIAAASLDPPSISSTARINPAVHIHQVYDTRDEFDGRGSCGPTSSAMLLASWGLPGWGLNVNAGGFHWSPYGRYITDAYTYAGVTFSNTQSDYSGRGAWAGAHGAMFLPGSGSDWTRLHKYVNDHTGGAVLRSSWDPVFVRDQIDRGNRVAVGGNFHGYIHIVLIKGYTDDDGWVVNDPYGPKTSGKAGGSDQIYYVGTDMRGMVHAVGG